MNGIIELDSEFGKQIGFTSDKFSGYLWKAGRYVTISIIESLHPNQGHLRNLFKSIEGLGFKIKVPTPLPNMLTILEHWGYTSTEEVEEYGIVNIWSKE